MTEGAISPARTRVSVLLVDDHPVVRQGIRRLLEQGPGVVVCAEAGDVNAALAAVDAGPPDLAIIDICLPGEDGLSLVKRLRDLRPELKIIVLSMFDEETYASRALRAGARGYVTKQEAPDSIVKAVQAVMAGEIFVSDGLRKGLEPRLLRRTAVCRASSGIGSLTDRELDVFRLIGMGWTMRRIAEELHISTRTVETHRANIRRKMAISSATELIRCAVQWVEEMPG